MAATAIPVTTATMIPIGEELGAREDRHQERQYSPCPTSPPIQCYVLVLVTRSSSVSESLTSAALTTSPASSAQGFCGWTYASCLPRFLHQTNKGTLVSRQEQKEGLPLALRGSGKGGPKASHSWRHHYSMEHSLEQSMMCQAFWSEWL